MKRTQEYNEYMRIRRNLLSSINRMKKMGIDIGDFEVPKIPKKITEGSIRRIKKTQADWHYKMRHGSIYVQRYQKQRYARAIRSAMKLDREFKERQRKIYKEHKNADPRFMPTTQDRGIGILENIINKALQETDSPSSKDQESFYRVVKHRATIAIELFEATGTKDPELRKEYNINLDEDHLSYDNWMEMQQDLNEWLWYYKTSMNYDPEMSTIDHIISIFSKELTLEDKKRMATAETSVDEVFL